MAQVVRAFALVVVGVVLSSSAACGPAAAPAPRSANVAIPVAKEPPPLPLPAPTFAEPQWQRGAGPPLTLTASDGTGLVLKNLSAHAVVNAPLAFTELALSFDNPRDQTIEGRFSITLPPRATITRFAMRTSEGWQEGEVVELQAARRAYEDFLHRRQDPALLEQGAGNQFTARVFPIPAHATKELIVSYAEELVGDAAYTLALKGLPEIASLDVAVTGGRGAAQTLKQERTAPAGDLVFDRRTPEPRDALRSGRTVVARVKPLTDVAPDPIRGLLILFDTSGSRALGFQEQTRLLAELIRKLTAVHGSFALRVACYDQTVESVFDGPSASFGDRELLAIKARAALGASNVERALSWAREHVAGTPRVVVVTDGVATAGATDAEHMRSGVAGLREAGVQRLDVMAVGGIRDEAVLKTLVVGGFGRDGVVASGDLGADRVARKLGAATRSGIAVKVEGATFTYPEHLDGMQPGDEAIVYAEVPETAPVRITVGSSPSRDFDAATVDAPLLEHAFAQARIGSLLERESKGPPQPELHAQIVELAVAHRVVTPYTALLVLETEQDYARFGLERRAPAEILTVDQGRLVARSRSLPKAADAPKTAEAKNEPARATAPSAGGPADRATVTAPPAPSAASWPAPVEEALSASGTPAAKAQITGDSFGAGGLGLTGVGEGGGGRGEGIGLGALGQGLGSGSGRLGGSHQTRSPTLRQLPTQVTGKLPPEVIQRIVRPNFGRFRLCYENGLRTNPNLAGRVTVRFVIDRAGTVTSTSDGGSDLPNQGAIQCILRAFGNLSFPQPESGIVVVNYPILFSPGDATPAAAPPGRPQAPPEEKPAVAQPYDGKLREVMDRLAKKDVAGARAAAQAWHDEDAGDILGLVALGEALTANKEIDRAARAYGSIIDLFPSRADMRRFAGSRLEGLNAPAANGLALDAYAKAKEQRPDHSSSHRLYAWSLFRAGEKEKAFEAAAEGLRQHNPGRFPGVKQILEEDLGLLAAAWMKAEPKRAAEIKKRLTEAGGKLENAPSIRFVLTWETDANDVDFHIYDGSGGHAFYGQKHLRSGGDLYADVTTGYGPECFTIRRSRAQRAAAYTLQANYYSRGPMGYGMGKLEVIDHDGNGNLTFEQHPYVVMVDHAFVNLGVIKR